VCLGMGTKPPNKYVNRTLRRNRRFTHDLPPSPAQGRLRHRYAPSLPRLFGSSIRVV